jgi:hypothetical protein
MNRIKEKEIFGYLREHPGSTIYGIANALRPDIEGTKLYRTYCSQVGNVLRVASDNEMVLKDEKEKRFPEYTMNDLYTTPVNDEGIRLAMILIFEDMDDKGITFSNLLDKIWRDKKITREMMRDTRYQLNLLVGDGIVRPNGHLYHII